MVAFHYASRFETRRGPVRDSPRTTGRVQVSNLFAAGKVKVKATWYSVSFSRYGPTGQLHNKNV